MQTLISVFDDRATARRAIERLVQSGFSRSDLHLQEPEDVRMDSAAASAQSDAQDRAVDKMVMDSPEREIAVDRGVLESIGRFFTSLMGKDHDKHAGAYSEAVRRGSSIVVVEAKDDHEAETAAAMLHELGAVDVNDRAQQWRKDGWDGEVDPDGRDTTRPGVRSYMRDEQTPLRDIVAQRQSQPDTTRYANNERAPETLEDRAGRVATERAVAFGDGPRNEPRDADGKPSRE